MRYSARWLRLCRQVRLAQPHFVFCAQTLPVPPPTMASDRVVIRKSWHSYNWDCRADSLGIQAHRATYRQLGLLIEEYREEAWVRRNTVRGFGGDRAMVRMGELLLDAGGPDNPVEDYELEGARPYTVADCGSGRCQHYVSCRCVGCRDIGGYSAGARAEHQAHPRDAGGSSSYTGMPPAPRLRAVSRRRQAVLLGSVTGREATDDASPAD